MMVNHRNFYMEPSIASILPDLAIGVVSVLGLVYVVIKFLAALDTRAEQHSEAMQEREQALRDVEASVRESLYKHITESTVALQENTKMLGRVMNHFDTK